MAEDLNLSAKVVIELDKVITDFARLRAEVDRAATEINGDLGNSLSNLEKHLSGTTQKLREGTTAQKASADAAKASAAALKRDEQARRAAESAMIRQRYALYDVASSYGVVAAALLGASAASIKVAADFESAFTSVERTLEDGQTPAAIQGIRDDLIDLSTTIPKSFADIAQIATLGNQLGIAAEDLTTFTETVSQFSTITGITAEASAQAFGRIGNILGLLPDDYDNLASAIVYVGRTSAATEQQIIGLTERLGATASRAGFTADQVVGLAGALASVGVAPERAQGVLETYFNTLNEAVAEGGQKLQNFATITGLTSDALEQMVRSGQGVEVFERFLTTLNGANAVDTTAALEALGLSGLRVNEVLPRLANNFDKFESSLANSSKAYNEATELSSQYTKISDDLNTQFQLLVNSVNALVEELTGGLVPGIAGAVGGLVDFVNALREIAGNPVIQGIAAITLGFGTVVGVLAAYRAAAALATASSYALTTAFGTTSAAASLSLLPALRSLFSSLVGIAPAAGVAASGNATFITSATGVTVAAGNATVATRLLATAMSLLNPVTVGLAAVLVAIPFANMVSEAESAAMGLRSIQTAAEAAAASSEKLATATAASLGRIGDYDDDIAGLNGSTAQLDATVNDFFNQFFNATPALNDAREQLALIDGQLASLVSSGNLQDASALIAQTGLTAAEAAIQFPQYTDALAQSASAARAALGELASAAAQVPRPAGSASIAISKVGKAAGGAAPKVRTLVDYANDLSTVFSRAFDIRFGAQAAIDDVTDSFADLNERIQDAQNSLLSLTADRNVKEYFLSVAEAYDDQLRAGLLRGEIAELNSKIADTQADASTELQGNSKAAINNRKTITGLVGQYEDYIAALAASGADQATLNQAVARSRSEFLAQATALGYSNAQLQPYVASFNDMAVAIARIPRNITVGFNGDPALQAINEFMAKARATLGASIGGPKVDDSDLQKSARGLALYAKIVGITKQLQNPYLNSTGVGALQSILFTLTSSYNSGNYWDGGFTGKGGKYEPAGVVHRGEYVVPKSQVNQRTGLPYADALGGVQRGSGGSAAAGYANGGYAGSSMIMNLSPRDRALMSGGRGDVVIQIDGREIARAVSNVNKQEQFTGAG